MRRLIAIVFLLVFLGSAKTDALSFNLDSIAEWGRFPRFCVNTYRWGDKFFNTYDSLYVQGTGTKFNVKATADSFVDYYRFTLPDNSMVTMISDPSTSVGAYLTYLAVSVGYDINVSHLFGSVAHARSRYQFGFNCALLGVELYLENNNIGTNIKQFGDLHHLSIPFEGIKSSGWGVDLYYFFNNKRYSQAAAFNFSKIQMRSQGSFYAGLSIFTQRYDFDFTQLQSALQEQLPTDWIDHHYRTNTHNYGFRLGYGYNWVFHRGWLMSVAVSPTVGVKQGYVNSQTEGWSFMFYNRLRGSLVWNHGPWFIGGILSANTAIVSDRKTTFLGSNLSASGSIGYRFNLW
ncbi:MAG: DUF4421 domain-containing protein [Muribaculaceae bacterium]|nr:DUF4421 domain-containing protein [Muribaculaceae bacterium]